MNERFKLVREMHTLSQKEAADLIGISDAALSKIESGLNNPSNRTIKLFCREFNIREEWLRTGEGEMKEKAPEDLIDQLAHQYNVGEAGALLLHALVRVFNELGEERLNDIIDNYLIGDLYDSRMKDPRNKYASDGDSSETQSKEHFE